MNRIAGFHYNVNQILVMSQVKDQNIGAFKSIQHSSSGSESHESEQEQFAPVVEAKKQEKHDHQIKKIEKLQTVIEVESSRQRRAPPTSNPKPKANKRAKNKANEGENMIKKEERKRSAAPPELVTQSSKSSSSKSENQEKAAPEQPKESPRLYIGNLPLQLSQSQIRKLFKKHGSLKEVKLMVNSTTGKSKGFGFVQYHDIQSAIKAKYELSSHILDGLKITIEFCQIQ